jgi:DNA-binding MarR family transcriptional regulator
METTRIRKVRNTIYETGVEIMSHQTLPSVTSFLVKLRKADKLGLTLRDILVLYAIMSAPGSSGLDIATKLGIKDRSAISSNLARLERLGFIEDRRTERSKAVPAVLHPLPAGVGFWDEIKPE